MSDFAVSRLNGSRGPGILCFMLARHFNLLNDILHQCFMQINDLLTISVFQPLWLMEPKEVTQEQHIEFYKFISQAYDKPRYTLHYKTDVPLSIRAILYVPEGKPGLFELSRDSDVGVALYSRKILIKSKAENILPKWLRFAKGL